jgi:hypothetical protein
LIRKKSKTAYNKEYPPPTSGGGESANVIWGKNILMQREKVGKCRRIRKNEERK